MKDVTVSFATTAFIQVTNIATGLLAARLLLPEGRGELAEILLWAGLIVEFGILGLSDALLYRAATAAADPKRLFAATLCITAVLGVLMLAAGYVIEPYVLAGESPRLVRLAQLFLTAYVPIQLGALLVATLFQGRLEMATWNFLRALVAVAYLVFIGLFWLIEGPTVENFTVAYVLGAFVSLAAGLYICWRRGWLGWRPDWPTTKSLIYYGGKVHVGEMVNSARQRIDQALVALYLPSADLGLYVVALTVANGPQILAQTLANLAFPKISQQGETDGKLFVFGRYLRFTLAAVTGATVVLLVLNPLLLPLLFGQAFAPAVLIANIVLLSAPAAAAKLLFIQALKAWDRPLIIGHAETIGLVAAAASLFALLPSFGLPGAACSLVIANVVAAGAMAVSLHRSLGLPIAALLVPTRDDWRLAGEAWRSLRR